MESFGEFLNELPATVFRAKGILWFKESEQRHIFQLSGKRCDLKTDNWSSLPSNQLVFIGRDLDVKQIQSQLRSCLASEQVSVR